MFTGEGEKNFYMSDNERWEEYLMSNWFAATQADNSISERSHATVRVNGF